MLIDQIIADLVAPPEQAPPLYREELIIRLSMWMQFGAAQEEVAFAVCSCVVGYVVAHFEDAPPDQWPEYFQKFFLRALPARMLKSLFLTYDSSVPLFADLRREYTLGLEGLDSVAEVTRHLIWYKPESELQRDKVSLSSAYQYLARKRESAGRIKVELVTFRWLWRFHRDAVALLYVNKYDLCGLLMLDPTQSSFHKQIDELASDPIRLSTALAKAKWVEQRLTIKLHRNAAQTRQPPNYPDALVPQQASLQKLDRSAVASFSKALRSRKRLKRQL